MRQGLYTPEDDATILAMVADNKRDAEIAEALGRSAKSIRSRLCRIRPDAPNRRVSTPELDEAMLSLAAQRLTREQIAKRLGISKSKVRHRLHRLSAMDDRPLRLEPGQFDRRDDDHIAACIEQGGFIYREVIDGAVLTFNWRGAVIHEQAVTQRVAA